MTSLKKKILFLIPSLVGGGAERTLINLLNRINYDNYDIHLVVVANVGNYLTQVPPTVKLITLFRSNFIVRSLAYIQKNTGFNFFFKIKIQSRIHDNYDVAISYLDGNFTELLFFIKNVNKRYTWVHSSYRTNSNFSRFYNNEIYREKLKKERYGRLDGLYFVSQDSMEEFIYYFGVFPIMKVIYNLIDSDSLIAKSNLSLNGNNINKFQFLAIGSLLPVKGFDYLIKAARILRNKNFDFELVIAGKGPLEKKLKLLIKKMNLSNYVKLVGFVSNPYPLIKNCDVFVMSSLSEALPTVLCEAMILGKPTLVTDCSGCKEIVDHGKYGLMAGQNPESIAENMISYMENEKLILEYHQKSLERAIVFNDSIILENYYSIFDS